MNQLELQRKLMAVARKNPPSDSVPYAFEKRIMARLEWALALDRSAIWASGLWRATAPCIAIMLLLVTWSFFETPSTPASDLSQELENTVFAAAEQDGPTDSGW